MKRTLAPATLSSALVLKTLADAGVEFDSLVEDAIAAHPLWTRKDMSPTKFNIQAYQSDDWDDDVRIDNAKARGRASMPPVVATPSPGRKGLYDIDDGNHRAEACAQAGWLVPAFVPVLAKKKAVRGNPAQPETVLDDDVPLADVLEQLAAVDGTGDPEWVEDLQAKAAKYKKWQRVEWPVSRFFLDYRDPELVAEYADLGDDDIPPIVAVPGGPNGLYAILDGSHRANACSLMSWLVTAFVPVLSKRKNPAPEAASFLTQVFRAAQVLFKLPQARLGLSSKKVHGKSSRRPLRACAVAEPATSTVWFHPDALADLTPENITALVWHELAHLKDPTLSESDTDRLAERVTGKKIFYDDRDIQTTARGTRPRPSYLPEW